MFPVPIRAILRITCLFFALTICLRSIQPALYAQSAAVPSSSLEPGPKPPEVPNTWKQLVGIYSQVKGPRITILEGTEKLYWEGSGDSKTSNEMPISVSPTGAFALASSGLGDISLALQKDSNGNVVAVTLGNETFLRTDAGSDPSRFFHVTPSRPLDELRSEALRASPPFEQGPFREPELTELSTLDPAFHLDIRYAHSNNFLSTPVYTQVRAFMQRPAAEALLRVLHKLQPLGYGLLIHDAYRPWYVTKLFWDATPPESRNFVADPSKGSKHNRGCAVDITLYDVSNGQPIEMPGLYDEMSPRSFPTFPGGTSLQRWHRDLLRHAMESEGFSVNVDEWWHFDYKDWKHYSILNVPFEKLSQP